MLQGMLSIKTPPLVVEVEINILRDAEAQFEIDQHLEVIDGVAVVDVIDGDGLARERLDEELRAAAESQLLSSRVIMTLSARRAFLHPHCLQLLVRRLAGQQWGAHAHRIHILELDPEVVQQPVQVALCLSVFLAEYLELLEERVPGGRPAPRSVAAAAAAAAVGMCDQHVYIVPEGEERVPKLPPISSMLFHHACVYGVDALHGTRHRAHIRSQLGQGVGGSLHGLGDALDCVEGHDAEG